MNPLDALGILDQIVAQVAMNRNDTRTAEAAVASIQHFIMDHLPQATPEEKPVEGGDEGKTDETSTAPANEAKPERKFKSAGKIN